ncbi:MAG: hypothetical protein ACQEQV_04995 [Fibrobacterota bacterium]
MKRLCFLMILSSAMFLFGADEWYSRSGFQFIRNAEGPQRMALGGAGTALPTGYARFVNPALYGGDSLFTVSLFAGNSSFKDTRLSAGEFRWSWEEYFFGLSFLNNTVEDIGITEELQTEAPSRFSSWQSSDISLTAGVRRNDYFRWAMSFGAAFEQFYGYSARAFIFNAGGLLTLADERLRIGASVLNTGRTAGFLTDESGLEEGENLPVTFRGGVSYDFNPRGVQITPAVDLVYYHIYDSTEDAADHIEDRVFMPLGIEVSPLDWLTLRTGRDFGRSTDVVSFGFSLTSGAFTSDAGFELVDYDETTVLEWRAGLTFNISRFAEDEANDRADTGSSDENDDSSQKDSSEESGQDHSNETELDLVE